MNKKAILRLIILVAVICGIIALLILVKSYSERPSSYVSRVDGSAVVLPSQEGVVKKTGGESIVYRYPDGWQEQMAAEAREYAESIGGNIIAEIDAKTRPFGKTPETTVSVGKGGYDIVVRGALLHGCTGVTLYNRFGIAVAKAGFFTLDEEYRILNLSPGKYRIAVDILDVEGVSVDCLVKIILEMTTPVLDLPDLTVEKKLEIKNLYARDMVFDNNGIETIIGSKKSAAIYLAEGANNIVYYLKDGETVSPEKTQIIVSDTTPPVVELISIKETRQKIDKRAHFNLRINEYPAYIKTDGYNFTVSDRTVKPNGDGSYTFAVLVEEGERVVIEAADLVGNVSETIIERK